MAKFFCFDSVETKRVAINLDAITHIAFQEPESGPVATVHFAVAFADHNYSDYVKVYGDAVAQLRAVIGDAQGGVATL